jgi:hypothetical protein
MNFEKGIFDLRSSEVANRLVGKWLKRRMSYYRKRTKNTLCWSSK